MKQKPIFTMDSYYMGHNHQICMQFVRVVTGIIDVIFVDENE